MDYVISKAINTETRRLKVGDPVADSDNLAPHAFADLLGRGFIAAKPVAAAISGLIASIPPAAPTKAAD